MDECRAFIEFEGTITASRGDGLRPVPSLIHSRLSALLALDRGERERGGGVARHAGTQNRAGKLGWFGESGKCCVSRQKPVCFTYLTPWRPVKVPSRSTGVELHSGLGGFDGHAPAALGSVMTAATRSVPECRSPQSCGRSRRRAYLLVVRVDACAHDFRLRKSSGVPATGASGPSGMRSALTGVNLSAFSSSFSSRMVPTSSPRRLK